MKKIIIGLSVVVMTVISYGASVRWVFAAVPAQSTGQDVSTYTAYLVDSSVSVDTFFTNLSSSKTDGIIATKSLTKNPQGAGLLNATLSNDLAGNTFVDGKSYTFYTVILNGDVSSATHYMKTSTITDSGSGSTDLITMGFSSQASNTWNKINNIPEPTSGLLLLVGGALLALRRKQK